MRVLFFGLHVSMVRECEGTKVTTMLVWGTGDVEFLVQGMSVWVVHAVQVVGVCEMCMCLTRGDVRGD